MIYNTNKIELSGEMIQSFKYLISKLWKCQSEFNSILSEFM